MLSRTYPELFPGGGLKIRLPLELQVISYKEIEERVRELSEEEAMGMAAEEVLAHLRAHLPRGATIVDKKILPLGGIKSK
ncbi:MAG TPA: hypothetical protein ENM97_05890 [Moorella mulderi]|nr:hypothetical protein [Moorella mulderi]